MPAFRVIVAGAGVAGLEALLTLADDAGDRAELTLLAPGDAFAERPLAVAEPFALGRPRRRALADFARTAGAALHTGAVAAVDDAAGCLTTHAGAALEFEALLLATGARAVPALAQATTWDDTAAPAVLETLVSDIEAGRVRRLVVVVPPGPAWPVPAYELALLVARRARGVGAAPDVTLVTPEPAPLSSFGPDAGERLAAELQRAGVRFEGSAEAALDLADPSRVVLWPSGRVLRADRVLALPRLAGTAPRGVPADADGFVPVDEHCRVRGLQRVWAAGDGTASAVKHGSLAGEQADAAAVAIAAATGAPVTPRPFVPVLRGEVLTGRGLTAVGDPADPVRGKIRAPRLARYLEASQRQRV